MKCSALSAEAIVRSARLPCTQPRPLGAPSVDKPASLASNLAATGIQVGALRLSGALTKNPRPHFFRAGRRTSVEATGRRRNRRARVEALRQALVESRR